MQYSFKRDKGVGIHIQVGRGQDSLIFTFQIYNSLELAQIEKSPNSKTYIDWILFRKMGIHAGRYHHKSYKKLLMKSRLS